MFVNMLQQQKQPIVCSSTGPKCRFTLDNNCPSVENGSPDESQGVSESGWTMYLDQSLDEYCSDGYYNSKSLIGFEDYVGKNNGDGHYQHANYEEEDSSMASDASSGPQQLLDVAQLTEFQNGAHRLLSFNDQADLKLTSLDVAEIRQSKRRRLESDEAIEKDLYLLEDTASSPVCSSKSELTENEVDAKDSMQLSNVFSDSCDQADAVNKRLDLLQSILPERTICREETLGVAMDYISEMEQRIKAYEGKDYNSKGSNMVLPAGDFDGDCGVLKKRGLCLVPIPTMRSGV